LLTLFLLLYVYGGDVYLENLKVVSKTTKCRDFTRFLNCNVIFYRDFLTALVMMYKLCLTDSDAPSEVYQLRIQDKTCESISEDKCFFGTPLVYSGVSKTAKKKNKMTTNLRSTLVASPL